MKRALTALEVDTEEYSGHSLRAGLVTAKGHIGMVVVPVRATAELAGWEHSLCLPHKLPPRKLLVDQISHPRSNGVPCARLKHWARSLKPRL